MQARSPHNESRRRGTSSLQLAALSRSDFDIPPRTRRLIAVAGAAGIVVIAVGSLVGGQDQTIELDKILHFSGYAILAALFVLALRPLLFVPALLMLVGMGFLIEYLQSYTGRSMDFADGVANTLGVAVGASIALLIRGVYSYVRRELAVLHVRRNLTHFEPGGLILREGGRVRHLYVIKSGQVRLSKTVGDKSVELGRAQAGDVVGTLGALLGIPQFTTIEAVTPATLYRMELAELIDSAGGREQPVCTVLRSLAEGLRYVAERMANSELQREELLLATETHREAEHPGGLDP
jgi:CRP-like cAMP-binding protein